MSEPTNTPAHAPAHAAHQPAGANQPQVTHQATPSSTGVGPNEALWPFVAGSVAMVLMFAVLFFYWFAGKFPEYVAGYDATRAGTATQPQGPAPLVTPPDATVR